MRDIVKDSKTLALWIEQECDAENPDIDGIRQLSIAIRRILQGSKGHLKVMFEELKEVES
jgi:hypothetical protein